MKPSVLEQVRKIVWETVLAMPPEKWCKCGNCSMRKLRKLLPEKPKRRPFALSAMCKCGETFGAHGAAEPYDRAPDCYKFRPAKAKRGKR